MEIHIITPQGDQLVVQVVDGHVVVPSAKPIPTTELTQPL